ncbi:MAG: hypothetical protein AB7R90_09610 [Reyranellaceae bacterium]
MPPLSRFSSESSAVAAPVTRRQAIAIGLGGLVAAGGLIALGPRAFAFSIVDADAPIAQAFHSACGSVQYHEQLAAEVRSLLALKGEKAPEQIACPVCNCRVALAPPPPAK